MGQALLRKCEERDGGGLSALKRRGRRSRFHSDAYEEHLLLPDVRVVILTDRGIMAVLAPGFDRVHVAAQNGTMAPGEADIPAAELRWAVDWKVHICTAGMGNGYRVQRLSGLGF